VAHPLSGDAARAYVTFEAGCRVSEAHLRGHFVLHLAKFKVPAEFVVLDDLPKTESGKIAKTRLAGHLNQSASLT
jgi:acyl-coenzyme A synthetase/AMP-(fatty) acid ligase